MQCTTNAPSNLRHRGRPLGNRITRLHSAHRSGTAIPKDKNCTLCCMTGCSHCNILGSSFLAVLEGSGNLYPSPQTFILRPLAPASVMSPRLFAHLSKVISQQLAYAIVQIIVSPEHADRVPPSATAGDKSQHDRDDCVDQERYEVLRYRFHWWIEPSFT